MNPASLCLSIIPAITQSINPAPVNKIVKTHIAYQIEKASPGLSVNFDHKSCPHIAHYKETDSSIIIQGDTKAWRGKKEIFYTDALAKRDIRFETQLSPAMVLPPRKKKPNIKKWVLIGAAAVVAVGTTAYLVRRGENNQNQGAGITF